jgi:tetratricopeptide (TPR) repeat protein
MRRAGHDSGTSIAQKCDRILSRLSPDRRQETGILAAYPMRRLTLFSVVVVLLAPAAASAQDRGKSKQQVEFGIKVAQNNLWNEALYRWQKAVELDPTYAAAWNNLAIAYEHEGKFEEAKKAYERALELDPKNLMIRQNYDLFKEINDRTKRRSGNK